MVYIATFISRSGYCSRRNAISLIKSGRVYVNNTLVIDPTMKVTKDDIITIDKKRINLEQYEYILFNKPAGYITTTADEKGRKTVFDCVKTHKKLFSVGRLDQNTTGLLLLTNDGMLAQQLMHPRFEIEKEYHVVLNKSFAKDDFDKIILGIRLPDGFIKPDQIAYIKKNDTKRVSLVIHSGKKRVIRRLFAHLGYEVLYLDRVRYATLLKNDLDVGAYRPITEKELEKLQDYIKQRNQSKIS